MFYDTSVESVEEYLECQSLYIVLLTLVVGSISKDISIHMIIDGLDECESMERKVIIIEITKILRRDLQPGRVRAMFISQPEADIRSLLRTATIVRLSEIDNASDIAAYTKDWCLKIQSKFDVTEDKLEVIRALVCQGAGGRIRKRGRTRPELMTPGMFLFARLVLQYLHSQVSWEQLYESFLPKRFPQKSNSNLIFGSSVLVSRCE